jgi:hypothetical protein
MVRAHNGRPLSTLVCTHCACVNPSRVRNGFRLYRLTEFEYDVVDPMQRLESKNAHCAWAEKKQNGLNKFFFFYTKLSVLDPNMTSSTPCRGRKAKMHDSQAQKKAKCLQNIVFLLYQFECPRPEYDVVDPLQRSERGWLGVEVVGRAGRTLLALLTFNCRIITRLREWVALEIECLSTSSYALISVSHAYSAFNTPGLQLV